MKKQSHKFFKLSVCTAISLALILTLAGCGLIAGNNMADPPSQTEQREPNNNEPNDQEESFSPSLHIPGVNADNYPAIDGSLANLPLLVKLYGAVFGVSDEDAEAAVMVSGGTGAAWRTLLWGGSEILVVYEAPDGILDEFADEGIELEIDPIGRDGLVFLVNNANPVDDLSIEQLRGIYTEKITDWKDVGGDPGPISAFQRNPESGSQTLFLKLLMKGTAPMEPPVELVPGSMAGLIEAIAAYDGTGGAIGYSVFYYADLMYANPDLKLLSVNGVTPSFDSIYEQEYPLINDFFVVIRADAPRDSPARLLRDWFLTDEGTALLKSANYVPVR